MNLRLPARSVWTPNRSRGVLAAVAPIVGTARVASATGKIVKALSVAIEIAEEDAQYGK